MRRRAGFVVPPYNGHIFPHEAFPPWRSLRPVFDLIAQALQRSAARAPLRHLEVPLVQASKRILAVAAGELTPSQWHRRARVAIEKLQALQRASDVYAQSRMLTSAEALAIANAVDATIASLVEEVRRAPLPDEIRRALPELAGSTWPGQ